MKTVVCAAEAWYHTNEFIAAVTGAVAGSLVAFVLVLAYDYLRARRNRRAHFAALRAEMDYCRDLAAMYLRDHVAAPLYRLPTVAYSNSFPPLLADAVLKESEAYVLLSFFNEVGSFNRGLEQAEGARLIPDHNERDNKLAEEYSRNVLKARKLVPAESRLSTDYDRASAVVSARMHWYRP